MSTKPNALIFGLGGIGGIYAAILSLSGQCEVHVVARSNYAAVKAHGLRLVSSKFGNHESIKFAGVFRDCAEAAASGKTFDYVLCANKALLDAKPSLSEHLAPLISPSTSIVLLQNGVGSEAPLHASFPDTTIISAVVWTGGKGLPEENGVAGVEQFNREGLTIGVDYRSADEAVRAEEDAKLEKLVQILKAGGGDCDVTKDIQSERWVKVILLCPSSMMFDCFAGRPMEVESILGTPVRVGERLGVPVPTLLTLYTIIKALDYGNAHPETQIDGQRIN